MLDSETKKRIDNLRNILVGKLPSPEGQVEQITTGLVYKFMHDMDEEAVEMGGVASFFVGDFEKYSWKHLFNPQLGGNERVKLYSEAIENMYTNPSAPQLFRDIFKNSFLPFKDPSTLNMFLKEIDEFHYSHSEKLGDAFEYLLSFMGSQGDAGQFRTPRHIIDFIVEIVNPQKDETILDPACGTCGFLISSYKHILTQNTGKRLGDKLTASERKAVGDNLVGYDISPDMTRISLVNMYLHQFTSPQIHEYDTLSSEDRWNEYYDVVLANPPFFSPKGGIQPHSRFGVKSTRAEVLFVDYIISHLKPNGRAGIVVPDGIISRTGKAYNELRKKLVEDSLVGVISLPSGVFQPYSGVKTSILILDKQLHKKTDSVFFAKVENDGYSLGTQRTPISKNDLPLIVNGIQSIYQTGSTGHPKINFKKRNEIIEDSEFALNYLERMRITISDFPFVNFGDKTHFRVVSGGTPKSNKEEYWNGELNWLSLVDLPPENFITEIQSSERTITELGLAESSAKMLPIGSVIVSTRATLGRVDINRIPVSTNQGFKNIVIQDCTKALPEFVAYMTTCLKEEMVRMAGGATFKEISKSNFEKLSIPLPPLEIQQEIVDEIEGYQKIIDGCRQVVQNYKPTIDIDPSWEMVELGEVCEINPKKNEVKELEGNTEVSFVPMEDLNENEISFIPKTVRALESVYKGYTYFQDLDVLLAKVTPCFENGKAGIAKGLKSGIGFGSSEFYVLRASGLVLPEWIYMNVVTQSFRSSGVNSFTGTSGLRRVPRSFVESYSIPLPSMSVQNKIVTEMQSELKIIDGNKKLIDIYTKKIQDRIAKVWGEA